MHTSHTVVTALHAAGTYSPSGINDYLLGAVGSILGILIASRALGHYSRKEYGEMITSVGAGLIVGAFCWFPSGTLAFLKFIVGKFLN